MICPSCGQETDDNNRFCVKCGAPTDPAQAQAKAGRPAAPPPPPGMAPPPPPQADVAQPPQPPPQGGVQYAPPGAQQPDVAQPPQQPPVQQQYAPRPGSPVPGPYPQQTMQMPAQQYQQPAQYPAQGQYQQPAYGQGPYAPPPGQPYAPPPAGYQQGYPQAVAKGGGSTIAGILTIVAGGVIIGSTFLSWLSASGWQIMRQGVSSTSGSGLTLVVTGSGTVFFTGFFTLLLGALILAAGLMMLFRRRVGGILAFLFALPAAGFAAVDIAMVYTKMSGVSPGPGLWMFAAGSVLAIVLGIIGLASSGAS